MLPTIADRGRRTPPPERQCEVAFAQRKCTVTLSVIYTLHTSSEPKLCVCTQSSHEYCSVCVCIPKPFPLSFYSSLARHQMQCDITWHFNRSFRNLPGFPYSQVNLGYMGINMLSSYNSIMPKQKTRGHGNWVSGKGMIRPPTYQNWRFPLEFVFSGHTQKISIKM